MLLGVGVIALAYAFGIGPWRQRLGATGGVSTARVTAFMAGLLAAVAALSSPIHDLADSYLLSAHMVQHLLLTLALPPLMLIGTPAWLLRPLVRHPLVLAAGRLLTRPGVAFAVFNVTFSVWHVPALYDRALREHGVHILEHLLLIAAAVLTWWPVAGPLPELPRLSYPGQVLYLALQAVPATALGAVITFAPDPLYPWYVAAPRVVGLSALADQQLAGVIMWVPGSLIYLAALTVVFFLWVGRGDEAPRATITG